MKEQESKDRLQAWTDGVAEEIAYWREALQDPRSALRERLDPQRPFRDLEAVQHLAHDGVLRVLDVGSGACSTLGFTHPECRIDLMPVDALAIEYAELMRELGLRAPVSPIRVDGEHLLEVFPPESFDCAYSINAIDHCYDPLKVLENMLTLVVPGGAVMLNHFEYAGRQEGYEGLHNWDLFLEGERLILADRDRSRVVDVGEHFAETAELLQCRRIAVDDGGSSEFTCSARLRRRERAS